jgi:hypothetical protein
MVKLPERISREPNLRRLIVLDMCSHDPVKGKSVNWSDEYLVARLAQLIWLLDDDVVPIRGNNRAICRMMDDTIEALGGGLGHDNASA